MHRPNVGQPLLIIFGHPLGVFGPMVGLSLCDLTGAQYPNWAPSVPSVQSPSGLLMNKQVPDTSFGFKSLKLRCHDFSALVVSKTESITHFGGLVKQAGRLDFMTIGNVCGAHRNKAKCYLRKKLVRTDNCDTGNSNAPLHCKVLLLFPSP